MAAESVGSGSGSSGGGLGVSGPGPVHVTMFVYVVLLACGAFVIWVVLADGIETDSLVGNSSAGVVDVLCVFSGVV